MKVYLVRHGMYASDYASELGPGLSPTGYAQAKAAGAFLKSEGANPQVILTSGYLRATQTAQTIAEVLESKAEEVASRDFSPSGDPETMRAILEGLEAQEILVVGHMCSIGELARSLCHYAPLCFDTCTVVALEKQGATWKLLYFKDCGADARAEV